MPMERQHTCCFTGHRPNKLPWGTDEGDDRCAALKDSIARTLETLYAQGYRHFISGMAQGADFYFAEAALALRRSCPDVTVEAALPCEHQARRWPERDRDRWQAILDSCDLETLVQNHYDRWCMLRRDRYMVNRSAAILAVYGGSPGGTRYTLSYAMDRGLSVFLLDPCRPEAEAIQPEVSLKKLQEPYF